MAGLHVIATLTAAGALLALASPAPDVTRSDVVIVGARISGLAAAIEAEKAGATVTVLERKARARANDIALTLSGALRLCRVLSGLVLERLR
jgi:NADPH-dependent 2,4-dienoyl-CoA reductase/sulfur reductase-like enzyme